MDESTEGSAVERLFEWLKQKHPDADNEALLDKALANVDAFAQRSGESPEALRTLRAALQSAANRLEFPSRLLRHGSEPVRAADIRVGAVYYDVGYYAAIVSFRVCCHMCSPASDSAVTVTTSLIFRTSTPTPQASGLGMTAARRTPNFCAR